MDFQRHNTTDGAVFVAPYDKNSVWEKIESKLSTQTETPTPSSGERGRDESGGPVTRFNNIFTGIGEHALEALSLNGYEIANGIRTRRDELFRNEFPLLRPRFAVKCTECETEYQSDVDECELCDAGEDALRRPSPEEKRRFEKMLESVNKEGQSFRELAKYAEDDQWRFGVPIIVLTYSWTVATDGSQMYDAGEIVSKQPEEMLRGDPKQIVPVVDEDGRVGGHWYICPVHRDDHSTKPGFCDKCSATLREVYFCEPDGKDNASKYYLEEEILTYPYAYPRLHGLDGLSPAHHVWLKQAILEFMDEYAGAFYDTDSERMPNQMGILHTTNPDQWEQVFEEAREDAKDDEYDTPFFTNEYSPTSSSTPELQIVDTMPDELLGQNGDLKKDFKSDIRQAFGITDVFDSELEDAGGLNNEGLQIEVTDRSIASQQHDYVTGWLDTLAKRLGIEDWMIAFVPGQDQDVDSLQDNIKTAAMADKAGLDARLEDGEVEVADGDVNAQDPSLGQTPSSTGFGGFGDDGSPDGGGDAPGEAKARDGTEPEAVRVLREAEDHIVRADAAETKAEPFFDEDDDIPEFVETAVREALDSGAIHSSFEQLSSRARAELIDFFEEKLTQPQGWSLESLATDIEDRFGVSHEYAETLARDQAGDVLRKAREVGYREQGELDERVFKHVGPADDRKSDACWWLLEETNPAYGGTPRPLDEYKGLIQEANRRFVDGPSGEFKAHIGCRDTYVEHFD
ncbi:hypothetical protein Hbl1158_10120 [Halobaculum sp. CBA1158]|uniref:heavy metal-binding domain-containing protein n=1 Tax=Halobaculum sp. CBA1158 TaxID=2904243 RepID=UPI001F1A9F76|nr:heavy metal-binding domain-containing protein [Halobaculum sp. CBA1158]UIO98889.1 hypothetical protein Hbl1158_10120 [Halobaculum sp. CBA1158]